MNKLLFLLGLILMSFVISSCGEDSDPPVINIAEPRDGQVFMAGDVIQVTGLATDDIGVTAISFVAGGDPQPLDLSTATDPTSIPFTIDLSIDAAQPAGDFEIEISATDEDDQTSTDTVTFTVQ